MVNHHKISAFDSLQFHAIDWDKNLSDFKEASFLLFIDNSIDDLLAFQEENHADNNHENQHNTSVISSNMIYLTKAITPH